MDEWEELFNEKHQRKYWKNKKTGKSSWHDPAKGEGGATAAASSETVAVKAEGAATSAGGAEEWEELFSDKHNRKYWKNKVTGKSSWTAPETTVASKPAAAAEASSSSSAAAASEWEELYNEKHKRKYWKNKVTGKSSWTAPEVAASAAATENKVAQESQAEEWEELFSEKHNRKYWKSKLTGKSSWTAPPAKPAVEASTASESKAAAADEWEELYNDKHKRKYWKNKVTGKSSWTKPEVTVAASAETKGSATETKPATEEWEELFNEKHKRKYWKNKVTGKTSWTPPPAAAPGATSSAATSIPSKAEEKKETIVIKPFEMLFRSSLKVGELKNEDSNKQFWSQLSGTMDNLSLELYAITTPEDITNKLLPEISSTTSFIEGCTEFRKIQTSNIATITCNTARGTVAIELNEGGGESENKGETGSTANQHNNNLVLVFNSPTAAYKCLQTLKRAKAMKDKIEAAEKDEDKSKLQKLIVDHSNKFRILQQYSSLETFVTAFDLNQILGPMLKLEGGFALSDLQVFRQQPSLRPELLSQVVVLEEKFTQEWKKFHSNIKSSLTKFAMEEVSTLPLEGIAVIKVSFQTTTTSNDTQQLSWMPCWIKLDQTGRNIAFHEHGPTQTSSFIVNCQSAQIHLKDMTEYGENIEIHLKNAKLVVNDANSKMMNVQFLFKTCDELWRWCLALSSICGEMAWQSAEHNHHVNIDTSFNIADKTVLSNPLSFVHFQSTASDVLTALEYPLAEREVSSELIRYHQITGADLKTAKFQILNQRIYVQNKGSAESLVEGSVLLSINGLSAIQLPGKTVMKFVSEVPKQMTTDVAVIKFPRAEYVVEAVEIEDALRSLEASLPVESKLTLGNPVNLSGSGVGAKKLDAESASQLQKMIIRKRSFIAQPGSLQDIIDAKANAAAESANNNNESNSKKTSESITIEKFKNSDQNDLKWTKYRIAITAGKVVLVAINQNGTHKFQLQTTHLRVIFSKQLSSLSQLCLELVDNKSHVVIRCPTYKIFQSLFRKLVIGLKLYGSLPIDLTWAYHQADKWRRGRDVLQFTDAMQPSPTVVTSGILAQMKLNEDKQKSMDAEDETNQSTVAHSIAGGEEPHNGLMHAAELLEQSLLQLDLPHSFPTASVVEQQIRELRGLNRTNHQMMSDFLTLQLDYSFPSSSNVAPVEPAVITQKSPFFNYNDSSTNNEESGGGNLNGDDEDVHEYNPSIDTPARSEAWEGDNNDMNELNPVPLSAPSNRRSSGINLTIDSGTGAPPPPSKNKLTRRASARMSISLESTNSLLAAAGIPGANTNVMSTRNAPPIAVMPSKPLSLSMEEQSALSTIFVHLRETPQDLLALVQKLNTAQDLGVFAHVLVNRIFSQWSCDQKQLEAVLDLLLQPEQPKSSIQQAINVGSLLYAQEKEEGKGNAYHLSIGDFAQALTSFKTSMAPSPSPMLIYILYEIVCRVDVVAFVEHLCSDMIVDTLVINSNVSEICSTIVEPLCSKLENAIDASQIPDILVYVMKLLAKYYHQNIHPKEFLASFLVPFVVNTITIVHKKKEENGNPTLDDHHLNVVVHRVKDLLMLCFDQSAAEKKLQLCLSDTAALSRSKWMLTRSLAVLMSYEELSAGNSGLPSVEEDAELSPIGQLGMLSTKQMKSRAIESFICLRPSELLFLLHCLDVSNITSSTLLATSRQLSNAFSALHRTNLVEKLSRFSVVNTSATGAKYKLFQSNALDREITYIVEIDPSSKSKDPWLDLLQDTVEHAVNHTAFSRDNSSGNNGNNPSMTSLDVNSDPFFLNTSSSNQLMDIDETQAASELSSIQWLINAAKSVLKRVYEDTMIFSKADATIRELADLRHRILNKRQIVQNSLQDWKKLLQSRELLSNYKAQISLLHDLYKNRKKVLGDHWRTHGLSTPGPNSGATGSSSGSSHEVYRYPLLMNSIRILTIYSANSSSGSDHHAYMSHHHAYGASGGGNSWMKAFQWVPSDEEKERALQKMIIIQLKLEKQLQSEQSNNAVATDFNPNNSLANNFSSSTRFGTVSFSASASSSIAPSPYPSRSGGPMLSSPTRPGSFKFNGGSNDEERHSAVGEMNANSNNSHLHIPSPATGGMNPLWAIMQNVFSNNSTNAYANLQAANAVSSPPPPPPPMQLSISARAGFKPAGK